MSESELHKEWSRLFIEGKAGYPHKAWLERRRRQEERAFIRDFVDTFNAVEVETLEAGERWAAPSPASSAPTGHGAFEIPERVQTELALRDNDQGSTEREGA